MSTFENVVWIRPTQKHEDKQVLGEFRGVVIQTTLPDRHYRAAFSGETFTEVVDGLRKHGMIPPDITINEMGEAHF